MTAAGPNRQSVSVLEQFEQQQSRSRKSETFVLNNPSDYEVRLWVDLFIQIRLLFRSKRFREFISQILLHKMELIGKTKGPDTTPKAGTVL